MSSFADEEGVVGHVRTVRPRWGGAVLVCGKCLKRQDDGKALRRALKAELKAQAEARPTRRKVRVVKIGCIGLCPRRAVVLASASTLSAGEVMLVKDAAGIAEALPRLLPPEPPMARASDDAVR